ncbi:hypothetical protein [Oribacterium sinus]
MIGIISFLIACVEVPREIYRAVMNHNYYHDLGNRDYWQVHDYYGNNVNIFEFENFLEDCGAEDITKGFYYKENGNTAICYDFNADGTRFVLDNEIQVCSGNYYSHSECPFANLGIAHYEENGNGYETWHDDAYGY